MARPTSLTPELIDDISYLIRRGAHPVIAARAYCIPDRRFYEWLARGRQRPSGDRRARARGATTNSRTIRRQRQPDIYLGLAVAVDVAEAQSEVAATGRLVSSAMTDPVAALLFLERRFPMRWQRSRRLVLVPRVAIA